MEEAAMRPNHKASLVFLLAMLTFEAPDAPKGISIQHCCILVMYSNTICVCVNAMSRIQLPRAYICCFFATESDATGRPAEAKAYTSLSGAVRG